MAFLRSINATGSEGALDGAARRSCRQGAVDRAAGLALLALLGLGQVLAADSSRPYQIKAAFIFNFAQFTQWPEEAFADKETPLVIGILGRDPFGQILEDTVRNEIVQGRRLVVERYKRVAEIKTCHILYIGDSEENRLENIGAALKSKPVLTVTEIENAAARGIIIELMTTQNRIRFRINLEVARAANLTLSSKLLRAGEIAKQ